MKAVSLVWFTVHTNFVDVDILIYLKLFHLNAYIYDLSMDWSRSSQCPPGTGVRYADAPLLWAGW